MSQVTSQNALVKDSTVQTLNGKLDNLNATLGGNANIAPVFNTATAYSKGDMVNYNGDLYVFTANHSAGAWTGSDAVQTKVSSELSSLKSGLTNLVKRKRLEKTTDSVGDFNFTLENNGILVSVRPLRSTDHYNSWWGAIIASTINNTGYSCKAIKDDGTALTSQSVLLDVYYI